jgi:hypothetical protein
MSEREEISPISKAPSGKPLYSIAYEDIFRNGTIRPAIVHTHCQDAREARRALPLPPRGLIHRRIIAIGPAIGAFGNENQSKII